MTIPVISGTGLFTPEKIITNAELVASFNAYADRMNAANAEAIAAGEIAPLAHSSEEFIVNASGIHQRYVMDKEGVLDPARMYPRLRQRTDDEPGIMAEMGVDAARKALAQAGREADEVDLVICAASNMERAYPAIAIEIQELLGARGFAFDMNVACSSATFGIQAAADMIRSGSVKCALVVNPEICSGHLEWRDRDCHFSNNIRNNNGFLRRNREPEGPLPDRRDMQFMQEGRKVFKEVVPIVSAHILGHLEEIGVSPDQLRRMWLHQANKTMNDFIGRKVLGRIPEEGEQPNILQDYANTSSAGSIIAFSKYSKDLAPGDLGVICSFGAGYSVGSVIVRRS